MHQFEQMFTASIYLFSTTFGQRFTCASTNLHSNKRSNFEVRTKWLGDEKGAAKA